MEFVQVDKGFLEGLLNNIFCVFSTAGIAASNRKHSSLVTLDQEFKGPLISVSGGRDKHVVSPCVTRKKDGWVRSIIHHAPLDQLHAGKRQAEVFAAAFALTQEVEAKAAPNSQRRKWLNFHNKTGRKSKVSKLSAVETVETVEAGEASRNGYEESEFIDSEIPRLPRSLNGVIESKKSAEWWNVINDENHEWTDRPKRQES